MTEFELREWIKTLSRDFIECLLHLSGIEDWNTKFRTSSLTNEDLDILYKTQNG